MSVLSKLQKNSKIEASEVLTDSIFFTEGEQVPTNVPMVNVALSGDLTGGILPGLTMIAGPSKHFKTCFSLLLAKAYLDKYPEAALLFYDSEFGSPQSYFQNFGIDPSRVLHTPITDIEELKNDLMNQLKNIDRGDKVFIIVDSIGNLASKKEVDDALEGKSVADMTRAKALKSLGRMITSHLTMKNIPMVAINHIYMCGTQEMKVITKAGAVSLKDVVVGTEVLTSNGYEPVLNKFCYENAYVTDIELEDGSVLSFTQGHRFKVNGSWVYVEDLREGMSLDVI